MPLKTAEQQAALMLAHPREGLIRRRTQLINMIRGYAPEFGLTTAKVLDKIDPLLARIAADPALPELAKELVAAHGREYARLKTELQLVSRKPPKLAAVAISDHSFFPW